jgi:hypothetical protein
MNRTNLLSAVLLVVSAACSHSSTSHSSLAATTQIDASNKSWLIYEERATSSLTYDSTTKTCDYFWTEPMLFRHPSWYAATGDLDWCAQIPRALVSEADATGAFKTPAIANPHVVVTDVARLDGMAPGEWSLDVDLIYNVRVRGNDLRAPRVHGQAEVGLFCFENWATPTFSGITLAYGSAPKVLAAAPGVRELPWPYAADQQWHQYRVSTRITSRDPTCREALMAYGRMQFRAPADVAIDTQFVGFQVTRAYTNP